MSEAIVRDVQQNYAAVRRWTSNGRISTKLCHKSLSTSGDPVFIPPSLSSCAFMVFPGKRLLSQNIMALRNLKTMVQLGKKIIPFHLLCHSHSTAGRKEDAAQIVWMGLYSPCWAFPPFFLPFLDCCPTSIGCMSTCHRRSQARQATGCAAHQKSGRNRREEYVKRCFFCSYLIKSNIQKTSKASVTWTLWLTSHAASWSRSKASQALSTVHLVSCGRVTFSVATPSECQYKWLCLCLDVTDVSVIILSRLLCPWAINLVYN